MPALALDDLLRSAGVEPRHGVQIVDIDHLVSVPFDPGIPLLILRENSPRTTPNASAAHDPLPGRHRQPGACRLLARLYPPEHLARRISDSANMAVAALTDADLAAHDW